MKIIAKPIIFASICFTMFVTITALIWYATNTTFAAQTFDRSTNNVNHFKDFTFFTATTTTATSTNDIAVNDPTQKGMDIKGAKKVNLYFTRGGATGPNTGSTNFRIQVSPDEGANWHYFNKLVQNLATSTDPTSLSSVTISAATSTVIVSLDLRTDAFSRMRCIAVETTDGEHTCTATVEF